MWNFSLRKYFLNQRISQLALPFYNVVYLFTFHNADYVPCTSVPTMKYERFLYVTAMPQPALWTKIRQDFEKLVNENKTLATPTHYTYALRYDAEYIACVLPGIVQIEWRYCIRYTFTTFSWWRNKMLAKAKTAYCECGCMPDPSYMYAALRTGRP